MSNMFGSEGEGSNNAYTASSSSVFDVSRLTWSSGIAWVSAILLILIGILVFIHYTLYPIFQFQPGGKGLIRVPGFKDNLTVWVPTSSPMAQLPDISDNSIFTNGQTLTSNWSFTLDLCILCPLAQLTPSQQNPRQIHVTPYRLLFNRGGTSPSTITGDTIRGVITGYNVAIALTPSTNDLIVSVLDSHQNPINIMIPNIPVQTPFRIGCVLMDNAFEVYLNGKLVQTSTVPKGMNGNKGFFQGPQRGSGTGSSANPTDIARVGNLNIWSRVALPAELRYAQPSLMPSVSTDSKCGLPGSGTQCPPLTGDYTSGEAVGADATNTTASLAAAIQEHTLTKSTLLT